MVTKAERERKNANQTFSDMLDQNVTHVRVGQGRNDNTRIGLLAWASEAHGLDGVCTCCPRRPAGEPSAKAQAIADARRTAQRAAELGPRRPAPLSVDVELPAR